MKIKKKLMFILGTRPEVIKLAPIINIANQKNELEVYICSTGQHKEMLHQTLASFDIVPDIDLALMKDNQTLTALTSRALLKIDDVLEDIEPDLVIVQGDTTTSFIGALSAFYRNIAIGHVEAGLRTYEKYSPFPEELNRKIIADLADWHFAPTENARNALIKEGILDKNIWVTGNTVVDAIEYIKNISLNMIPNEFTDFPKQVVNCLFNKGDSSLVLVTCHRRENFGKGISNICEAIKSLSLEYPEFNFVFPVHFNPNVKEMVHGKLGEIDNIFLIKPIDYKRFVRFMSSAKIIITDSGGIQEEVFSLNIPTLVMRNNTERSEGITDVGSSGLVKLVGTDTNDIVINAKYFLSNRKKKTRNNINPYGDGLSSQRIIEIIQKLI